MHVLEAACCSAFDRVLRRAVRRGRRSRSPHGAARPYARAGQRALRQSCARGNASTRRTSSGSRAAASAMQRLIASRRRATAVRRRRAVPPGDSRPDAQAARPACCGRNAAVSSSRCRPRRCHRVARAARPRAPSAQRHEDAVHARGVRASTACPAAALRREPVAGQVQRNAGEDQPRQHAAKARPAMTATQVQVRRSSAGMPTSKGRVHSEDAAMEADPQPPASLCRRP